MSLGNNFLGKVTFWKVKLHVTKSYSSFKKADHLIGLFTLDKSFHISSQLSINALRHVKDTGMHFFACKLVMSLDKNTVFLRFRLPVLLQQNLRCKVWDDTAKIRYIALFAISEQCLKLTAFHNSAHWEKCQNQYWASQKHFHYYHSTCSDRTLK